jgi:hypothetical protein
LAGLTDISLMLATLDPELIPGEFVFCTFPHEQLADIVALHPKATFREREGLTAILSREIAQLHGHETSLILRCISLHVHSDLAAVGLTATVAGRLTECGISANVVSGYFHDHIFIPADSAELALAALKDLQSASRISWSTG